MSEQTCVTCGGLGAIVEYYQVRDENGYEYTAMRDRKCIPCGGTGKVRT